MNSCGRSVHIFLQPNLSLCHFKAICSAKTYLCCLWLNSRKIFTMKTQGVSNLKSASTETTGSMVAMETDINSCQTAKRVFVFWRLYWSESCHFWLTYTPLCSLWDYRGFFKNMVSKFFNEFLCEIPWKNVCPWDTLSNISGKNHFKAKPLCNPVVSFIIYWSAKILNNPHSS